MRRSHCHRYPAGKNIRYVGREQHQVRAGRGGRGERLPPESIRGLGVDERRLIEAALVRKTDLRPMPMPILTYSMDFFYWVTARSRVAGRRCSADELTARVRRAWLVSRRSCS